MVANKRVLVLDDEDVVCRSYERVLTNAGFEVGKAHSGREALDEVRERQYDVMLADLKMPGMDGLSVVRKLRETNPQMRVIVITGYPSQDTIEEAAKLGVMDYLTKPVAPDVLTQATSQAMTAPPWTEAPRFSTTAAPAAPIAPATVTVPVPPLREEIAAPRTVEEIAAPREPRQPGVLQTAAAVAAAPLLGLAYVIFLPVAGFAVVLGLGSKALLGKLAKEV